jgi:nitrogen fixation protein NifQ
VNFEPEANWMNAAIPVAQLTAALPLITYVGEAGEGEDAGLVLYVRLTGHDPAAARFDDDHAFDAHVFASILAVAAQSGSTAEGSGLAAAELEALISKWFPDSRAVLVKSSQQAFAPDDETVMLQELLLAHRSHDGEDSRWLAAMIARRAMEANHLWEDLGLRNRTELSRLLSRHFAPIASRNTKNMRWKRFFYRVLCESDGFVMCSTPVCTDCRDFDLCFGEESGESRLAHRRREAALQDVRAVGG